MAHDYCTPQFVVELYYVIRKLIGGGWPRSWWVGLTGESLWSTRIVQRQVSADDFCFTIQRRGCKAPPNTAFCLSPWPLMPKATGRWSITVCGILGCFEMTLMTCHTSCGYNRADGGRIIREKWNHLKYRVLRSASSRLIFLIVILCKVNVPSGPREEDIADIPGAWIFINQPKVNGAWLMGACHQVTTMVILVFCFIPRAIIVRKITWSIFNWQSSIYSAKLLIIGFIIVCSLSVSNDTKKRN